MINSFPFIRCSRNFISWQECCLISLTFFTCLHRWIVRGLSALNASFAGLWTKNIKFDINLLLCVLGLVINRQLIFLLRFDRLLMRVLLKHWIHWYSSPRLLNEMLLLLIVLICLIFFMTDSVRSTWNTWARFHSRGYTSIVCGRVCITHLWEIERVFSSETCHRSTLFFGNSTAVKPFFLLFLHTFWDSNGLGHAFITA